MGFTGRHRGQQNRKHPRGDTATLIDAVSLLLCAGVVLWGCCAVWREVRRDRAICRLLRRAGQFLGRFLEGNGFGTLQR